MNWTNFHQVLQPKTRRIWKAFYFLILVAFFGLASSAYFFRLPAGGAPYTGQPLSIIILGKDSREQYNGNLTDTMILATLNPQTQKMSMLSIPRDTRVIPPGDNKERKINSVFKEDGGKQGQLLKKTLESIYGIPITNYVVFDFEGFRQVVDLLGGIQVNVDKRMIYHDPTDGTVINLYPGVQTLNGEQALGFVRHRHDDRGQEYFSSDFDRNRRQQIVIKTILEKATSLYGLGKAFELFQTAGKNIQTDLSPNQLAGLAWDYRKMGASKLEVVQSQGEYWDHTSSFVLIPQSTLDRERQALQQTMGVAYGSSEYNNSPAGE